MSVTTNSSINGDGGGFSSSVIAYNGAGIRTSNGGYKFDGTDESATLIAQFTAAQAAGLPLIADHQANGPICIGTASSRGAGGVVVQILASIYGQPAGNLPEFCSLGESNAFKTTSVPNLNIENVRFRRPLWESLPIVSGNRDTNGIYTVVTSGTTLQMNQPKIGDIMNIFHSDLDKGNLTITAIDVPNKTLTMSGGILGSPASFDLTKVQNISAATRVKGVLSFTTASPHKIERGQTITVTGEISTSPIDDLASVVTQAGTVSGSGLTVTGLSTGSLAIGMAVTGAGIAAGVWIEDIPVAGTITLVGGVSTPGATTLTFRKRRMTKTNATVVYVSSSIIKIEDDGPDDTALSTAGCTIAISQSFNYSWAVVKRDRAAGYTGDQTSVGSLNVGGYGHRLKNVHGTGVAIYVLGGDFTFNDCTIRDTVADGFHVTQAGRDITFQNCHGYDNRDDAFPIVGYLKFNTTEGRVTYINCSATRCNTRGFLNSGGQRVSYINCASYFCNGYALRIVLDESTYPSTMPRETYIFGFISNSCGIAVNDYNGTASGATQASAVEISGGDGVMIEGGMQIRFSRAEGMTVAEVSDLVMRGQVRIYQVAQEAILFDTPSISTGAIQRVNIDSLSISDTGTSGITFMRDTKGLVVIDSLTVEDINSTEAASKAVLDLDQADTTAWVGRIAINNLFWDNQRYNNAQLHRAGSAGTISNANVLTIGGYVTYPGNPDTVISMARNRFMALTRRPLATWTGDPNLITDAVMTMTPAGSTLPAFITDVVVTNGAVGTAFASGTAGIQIRSAAAGAGNQVFAGSRVWQNFAARATTAYSILSNSYDIRGRALLGSPTLYFTKRWRPDGAMVGQLITGTGVPAGASVKSVDYKAQTITMGMEVSVTPTVASPTSITDTAHGLTTGMTVLYRAAAANIATGLTNNTTYTVTVVDANTYTLNGTNVTVLGGGTGQTIYRDCYATATSATSGIRFSLQGMQLQTATANCSLAVGGSLYMYRPLAGTGLPTSVTVTVYGF